MYLISICIPTYNGAETLQQTIESILRDMDPSMVEVVIHDDCSTDRTLEIADEYARKYKNISVYENEQNVGMDRNFTKSALKAHGEYVWFCGQDDVFEHRAISKAIEIINTHHVNFIYFNYKFVSGDLSKEVFPPKLPVFQNRFFETFQDYVKVVEHAPTFLPAIVMKREFWEQTAFDDYFDTYYVQVGVWLENSSRGKIYVVGDPKYVLCRVPEDSWKYHDGKMLFNTPTGSLKVYKRAHEKKKIPASLYKKIEAIYIRKHFWRVIACRCMGYDVTTKNIDDLRYIFNHRMLLYAFYIFPWLFLPKSIATLLYTLGKTVKRVMTK